MTIQLRAFYRTSLVALLVSAVSASAQAPTTFVHPGVLLNQTQLNAMQQAYQGNNPHLDQVNQIKQQVSIAMASNYGQLTYTSAIGNQPGEFLSSTLSGGNGGVEQCGSHSIPDVGCSDSESDSAAAYVQALLWAITGTSTYATNAITIMNTYSSNFKGFAGFLSINCPGDSDTCSNGPLQAAWDAEKWTRAAEIIGYATNVYGQTSGWTGYSSFTTMLHTFYFPLVQNGSNLNGNWDLAMIDAAMGISVMTGDSDKLWTTLQKYWRERVQAYFYYQQQDGNYPQGGNNFPPAPARPGALPNDPGAQISWYGQTEFDISTTGVAQEMCRDLGHTEYSISAAINAAETDWIQGGTLYTDSSIDARERLTTSLNLMAWFESENLPQSLPNHPYVTAPSNFCSGSTPGQVKTDAGTTYAIAYNEYHNRLGALDMVNTGVTTGAQALGNSVDTDYWIQNGLLTQSPKDDEGHQMTLFEPLTHYAEPCLPIPTGSTWKNTAFTSPNPAPQAFTVYFNATPSASSVDAMMGLSSGAQSSNAGLSVILHFNPKGYIETYNGATGSYVPSSVTYTGGTVYHFSVIVYPDHGTFTATVTPDNASSATTIASGYTFRAGGVDSVINNIALNNVSGSNGVCSFNLHP